MRIAVASDVHGNPLALDAMLADARSLGVGAYWFLGDFCAIGPEPVAVLERIARLESASFIRGNTDRYIVTGERPPPTAEDVRADPSIIVKYGAVATSIGWTQGVVTAAGWLDWLEALPLELRTTTADGARILAVHAAPGTDDGDGLHPGLSDSEVAELIADADADLILVGHTHEAMGRRVGRRVVANLGSLSNPRGPDTRASYVVLEIDAGGVALRYRHVSYDSGAFVDSVLRSRHPATDFILSYHRGEQRPRMRHADHVALTDDHPPIRIVAADTPAATARP